MNLKNLIKAALPFMLALSIMPQANAAPPSDKLLTPTNHTLILIDHQPQMAFATRSIDIAELRNNGYDATFVSVPHGHHAMLDHVLLWQDAALEFVQRAIDDVG